MMSNFSNKMLGKECIYQALTSVEYYISAVKKKQQIV